MRSVVVYSVVNLVRAEVHGSNTKHGANTILAPCVFPIVLQFGLRFLKVFVSMNNLEKRINYQKMILTLSFVTFTNTFNSSKQGSIFLTHTLPMRENQFTLKKSQRKFTVAAEKNTLENSENLIGRCFQACHVIKSGVHHWQAGVNNLCESKLCS